MQDLVNKLSKELEIPKERIINESINVFLERELRNASAEILEIKTKFNVSTPKELKNKLEKGLVDEHPAWEKLIYWENLEKRMRVVNNWIRKLYTSS